MLDTFHDSSVGRVLFRFWGAERERRTGVDFVHS